MMNKTMNIKLTTITGLLIGGTKDIAEIGGLDCEMIRNPVTGQPYIPGSSIKGKMRCLLEMAEEKSGEKGGPCNCGNCDVCRLFGSLNSTKGPTRLIVRDAVLDPDDPNGAKLFKNLQEQGLPAMEIKTETAINRLEGSVLKGSLRTQERVPPGYVFKFQIIYRAYPSHKDEHEDDKMKILKALELLQADTLGKSGSRGYGQIELSFNRDDLK